MPWQSWHSISTCDPIGSRYADVVFPAATWGEQNFVRANGERCIRLYQKFYDAPGDAKPDWWIIANLAKRMGFSGFDWDNANEVCEESSRFSRGNRKACHMIKVAAHQEGKTLHEKLAEFGTTGVQGPTFYNYDTGQLHGTVRLHDTTLTQEQFAGMGRTEGAKMTIQRRRQHISGRKFRDGEWQRIRSAATGGQLTGGEEKWREYLSPRSLAEDRSQKR